MYKMSIYDSVSKPEFSISDAYKPKGPGRLKRAYNKSKSSISRGLRRLIGKETPRERADRHSRKQARKARKANENMKPFGGGKRKRRKTQRKPKRTRRTKRRTRRSRR